VAIKFYAEKGEYGAAWDISDYLIFKREGKNWKPVIRYLMYPNPGPC
jgi:hypothetical protein